MKKLFLTVISIVAVLVMLFFGVHIGTPCPSDARDFANHMETGSNNHLPEFGGVNGAIDFLNKVASGEIPVRIWGDDSVTFVAATSSPYGPVVIIFGSNVLPTMYATSIDKINNLTRGLKQWTGQRDFDQARSTAGCFATALQPATVSVSAGSWATSPTTIVVGFGLLFVLRFIFILGKVGSRGGLTA